MLPQKRLGQHFLISSTVVAKILTRLEGLRGVLEIGPGPGVLTGPLSDRTESVIAVELDPIAVSALAESAPKARVLQGDALATDLRSLLSGLPEPHGIVSNMPYNITGPLLGRFAECVDLVDRMVLMMQKEVGERVCAKAGDRNRGALSVFLQLRFQIERIALAPPGAFYPPPKVESVVLQLTPAADRLAEHTEQAVMRIVRAAFAQPRKTLANNLAQAGVASRLDVESALIELGHTTLVRPHQLDLSTWERLTRILSPTRDA